MRIGVDVRELKKDTSTGIARFLLNVLASLEKSASGHQLFLYGNQYTDFSRISSGARTCLIPETLTVLWDQFSLRRRLKKDKIDLFFSPYYKLPLNPPCRSIICIHDILSLTISDRILPLRAFFNLAWKLLARRMSRDAVFVITPSEYSKKDLITVLKLPTEKVKVVYYSVSLGFRPSIDPATVGEVKKRYKLGEKYILYVGNFLLHKNLNRLIEAYSLLPEAIRKAYKLVLVGGGEKRRRTLEEAVEKLGLGASVVFTGMVVEEELVEVYNGAGLLVFPSLYEGFGLPPLEAMACGTPVVASNTTSLPEVVGNAGVLVDPMSPEKIAGGIEKVLTDDKFREELIASGLERSRKFSNERFSRAIMGLIEETAARRAG